MTNTIILKQIQRDRAEIEKVPAAAFYPGHLLEITTADKFQKHSGAAGVVAPKMFAVEDDMQGNTIDDAFDTSGRAVGWIPQPGDEVYAVLADGETATIGSKLVSNADGTLKVGTANVVGMSLEAIDLSDSSGAESDGTLGYDKRIKIVIS